MAEKDFKEAVAYSKTVMPPMMRRLIVKDDDGMVFLGRENLQSMIDEWQLMEKAAKTTVEAVERMNREYNQNRPTEFYARELKRARYAQRKLSGLLDRTESRPLFCDRRKSPKDFAIGESVFTCFTEDDPAVFAKCTVTGYKDDYILVSLEVYDDEGNESMDEGYAPYNSEYLYNATDLKFLALHPEYFSLFTSYLRFKPDDAQILYEMIEDCVVYYYPELEAELIRLAKEAEEEEAELEKSADEANNDATTAHGAT